MTTAPSPDGRSAESSEYFGIYADHVQENFTLIGNGVDSATGGVPLHSRDYGFNAAVLPVGARDYRALVHEVLS